MKNSGKKNNFLSSQTSSPEENSHTPNAQGVSGDTALTRILPPYATAQEAQGEHRPGLGPTPVNQPRPGVGPRFGPRPRPGLAKGCESEIARPVYSAGLRGYGAAGSASGAGLNGKSLHPGKSNSFRKNGGRRGEDETYTNFGATWSRGRHSLA